MRDNIAYWPLRCIVHCCRRVRSHFSCKTEVKMTPYTPRGRRRAGARGPVCCYCLVSKYWRGAPTTYNRRAAWAPHSVLHLFEECVTCWLNQSVSRDKWRARQWCSLASAIEWYFCFILKDLKATVGSTDAHGLLWGTPEDGVIFKVSILCFLQRCEPS